MSEIEQKLTTSPSFSLVKPLKFCRFLYFTGGKDHSKSVYVFQRKKLGQNQKSPRNSQRDHHHSSQKGENHGNGYHDPAEGLLEEHSEESW